MKIEKITPFLVDRFLLVRVYTDAGIVGNGEAGLWAHHRPVYQAIQDLSDYYVGKDPLRIEHHYQTITRDTHFMGAVLSAAVSAIDMALWDIFGKSTNLPIYQLLGGKTRDKVKVFANANGDTVEACVAAAAAAVAKGYESLRTMPYLPGWEQQSPTRLIDDIVRIVAAIREAVGYNIDLGVEAHRSLRPEEAITLARELEPYRLLYLEDPLAPESHEAFAYIARHINIPMAGGERLYNLYQFKELLDHRIVSLIRPDLSLAGGYTQLKKIAGLAESAFVGVFPHLMGSPLNIAAFVQFDAATPNFVLHEDLIHIDVYNELVDNPVQREGGYIIVPDRPGIGLDIVESKLAKYPYVPKRIAGHFNAAGAVTG